MSINSICLSTTGGTGFFYHNKKLNNFWLVTNRHNLFPLSPKELETSEFSYSNKSRGWCELIFTNKKSTYLIENGLNDRLLFHKNPKADVIAINIDELFIKSHETEKVKNYIFYKTWKNFIVFNKNNLPKDVPKIGDQIIVIGFPLNENNKPQTIPQKSEAKIVSDYSKDYNDQPYFLIDKQLHTGSSGSPVFLKSSFKLNDLYNITLLGIYAGNHKDVSHGVVFRSRLISEIID
jgi:hypothetical protein